MYCLKCMMANIRSQKHGSSCHNRLVYNGTSADGAAAEEEAEEDEEEGEEGG